jgi:hypothetical protein
VRRGKRSIIRMEGPANDQDLEKNGDPKIEEEFDKYFDKPTATGRRKTTLPTKGCPFTRRNLNICGDPRDLSYTEMLCVLVTLATSDTRVTSPRPEHHRQAGRN